MRKRRPPQLDMSFGWGGWRRGAGRKKVRGRKVCVPHRTRPPVRPRYPLHVTARFRREFGSMRTDERGAVIRGAFVAVAAAKPGGFRVVDWSIQGDHLHLIVEARDNSSLSRGMQGLCVRVARAVNAHLRRSGTVFAERYNARELKWPRQVRNARAYVLNNHHRHDAQRGQLASGVDPFSSWAWFDGWRDCPREQVEEARAGPEGERPVAEPHTWLLRKGWRRHGLVEVDEIPGLRRSAWRIQPGEEPDWSGFELIDTEPEKKKRKT